MNFSKALALVAVSGIAAGLAGCGGSTENTEGAATPGTDPAAAAPPADGKASCKSGGGGCKSGSGCKAGAAPADGTAAPADGAKPADPAAPAPK